MIRLLLLSAFFLLPVALRAQADSGHDKHYYMLDPGEVRKLPAGARYESSDPRVATAEGTTITARADGDCLIYLVSESGRAEFAHLTVGWGVQNPVLPYTWNMHVPDSEVHNFGGKLYVYGSLDASRKYCAPQYISLMTPDLRHWESRGYSWTSSEPDSPCPGKWLWDSDGHFHNEKYYLYGFYEWDPSRENYMFVLEGDDPMGPFRDFRWIVGDRSGKRIDGISAEVFTDDDGERYITYAPTQQPVEENYPVIARLTDGHTIAESSRTNVGPWVRDFYEGPSLRKRGDTYYFVYAENCGPITETNRVPARLSYATSRHILGPYTYRGTILTIEHLPGNSNIQGSIEQLDGQWYVFYHRALNGVWNRRALCVERIEFDTDGLIRQVTPSSSGVAAGLDTSKPLWFNTAVNGSGYTPDTGGRYGRVRVEGSAEIGFRYVALTGQETSLLLQGEGLEKITSVNVLAGGRSIGSGSGTSVVLREVPAGPAELILEVTSSGELFLETAHFSRKQ